MQTMSRVITLSNHLMDNSKFVKVVPERVEFLADFFQDFKFETPSWNFPPFYPQSNDFEEMCLYYLLFNSINYCYFDEYYNIFRDGDRRSSTLAGMRITENWEQLKDPLFLSRVDETYLLGELFKAESPISLVKERAEAFREIGSFMLENTDFTFRKLFSKHYNNIYFVSQMIPTYFKTWRDPFFKRPQLFVGMVQGRFQEDAPFDKGLEDLTVYADYRVPQTLHAMGIIEYSAPLLSRIASRELIPSGSRQELEIRAASLVGADLLMLCLNKYRDENINALEMDYFLWSLMHKSSSISSAILISKDMPHHLTMTTDY